MHQSLEPTAKFRFVNVAEWESAEYFQRAVSSGHAHLPIADAYEKDSTNREGVVHYPFAGTRRRCLREGLRQWLKSLAGGRFVGALPHGH
jgi:hypothetical protein